MGLSKWWRAEGSSISRRSPWGTYKGGQYYSCKCIEGYAKEETDLIKDGGNWFDESNYIRNL